MTTKISILLLTLALACTRANATTTHPEPDLCTIDGGRWCVTCSGSSCQPGGDSGWLCCSGGVCVPVTNADECTSGVVGWCSDYYEKQTVTGSTVAICEDSN
jgi:hypothetical protein